MQYFPASARREPDADRGRRDLHPGGRGTRNPGGCLRRPRGPPGPIPPGLSHLRRTPDRPLPGSPPADGALMFAPIFRNRSGDGDNEQLDDIDYRVLAFLLDGVPADQLDDLLTLSREQIRHRLANPRLQTLLRKIERGIVERLA